MTKHLISDDAGELIIEQEVSGHATYTKKYQHPERPGGESGITIGIGYDCGYSTAAGIRKDWGGRIPDAMVEVLATRAAGLKGSDAAHRLAEVQPKVTVPWEAAIAEFYDVEVPRWLAKVRAALPNLDLLPPDCIGALVSLAYNRGVSFTIPVSKDKTGRYIEMRNIRALMMSKQFANIPAEFRKMKRLWTTSSVRGVAARREEEAKLFERGLAAHPVAFADVEVDDLDQTDARAPTITGDDRHADYAAPADDAVPVAGAAPAPVADSEAKGDPGIFSVQKRLKAMHYSPGILDGRWGGGTSAAISAFINDRGGHIPVPASLDAFNNVSDDIKAEIQRAESENFVRPVTEARKTADAATVATVAPEVVPAKRNFLAALWAAILAFFGSIWDTISGWFMQAWNLFADHKDDLPEDSGGFLSTAWEYVKHIPAPVWWLAAAGLFVFLAMNARSSVKKITESVQTGARQ